MIILAKVALVVGGAAVLGAAVMCSEGFVDVRVDQSRPAVAGESVAADRRAATALDEHHIHIIAPALLITSALHFVPESKLQQAGAQIRPYLPALRAALDDLRHSPDACLVEVRQPREGRNVEVCKRGGSLDVDVSQPDQSVHVSVPIRAIASALGTIAAAR